MKNCPLLNAKVTLTDRYHVWFLALRASFVNSHPLLTMCYCLQFLFYTFFLCILSEIPTLNLSLTAKLYFHIFFETFPNYATLNNLPILWIVPHLIYASPSGESGRVFHFFLNFMCAGPSSLNSQRATLYFILCQLLFHCLFLLPYAPAR